MLAELAAAEELITSSTRQRTRALVDIPPLAARTLEGVVVVDAQLDQLPDSPVVSEYQCELLGVGQLSEEDGYAVARRGKKGNIEELRQPN